MINHFFDINKYKPKKITFSMFTKRELNQLEKYLKGDIIQEENRFLIEKLQSMGFGNIRFP